ncbi:MAG: YfiR family protein [Bryobacteraceae bacterium]
MQRVLATVLIPVLAAGFFNGNSDVETRIKAAFIYNFARFVEWPGRSGPGPVRIAVLGRGDLAAPLEEVVRGKTANGRTIEVTHISADTEMDCCEILVIERSESKHVGEIVRALADKPVLTVCDGGSCLLDGVMIVFQMVEESVRFQINRQAAEHAGLKISSQLLKVAIPAAGKHP